MQRFLLVLASVLATLGMSREANAGLVLGTLVIDFRLEWSAIAFDDGTISDGTFYSPHLEYLDQANRSWMDISIEPFLPSSSSPYQNTYTTTNFPLPALDNLPYGGFLAYYKTEPTGVEAIREGMIVGFAKGYTPVDDFDTLFNPSGTMIAISEADAIAIMKSPIPNTAQTPGYVFETMVSLQPDIMPRWTFDSLSNTYSLGMDLFAFSTPQPAGSSSSIATFSSDNPNVVPEPTGWLWATHLLLGGLGMRHFRRRKFSDRQEVVGARLE